MQDLIGFLVPGDMAPWLVIVVAAANFCTSAFTAAVGLGGGVAILAVMANVLPTAAVIPVHACVQFSNNASRTFLNRKHIAWPLSLWFAAGALAGAVLGSAFVITLPKAILQLILGAFVLFTILGPKLNRLSLGKAGLAVGGAATTFATFFVGATGPLVAAIMPVERMARHEVVSTHGLLMVLQHVLKIIFFGFAGFAFGPWIGFLVLLIVTGFAGAYAGSKLLGHVSEERFKTVFRIVLTLLALRLVYSGVSGLWFG